MCRRMLRTVQRLFSIADVAINGKRPWDVTVHEPRLYGHVLVDGLLGFEESYMDGDWDCDRLDEAASALLMKPRKQSWTSFAGRSA